MENSTVSIPMTKGLYHFIDTRTDLYALEYQKLSPEFIDTVREQAKAVGGLKYRPFQELFMNILMRKKKR